MTRVDLYSWPFRAFETNLTDIEAPWYDGERQTLGEKGE